MIPTIRLNSDSRENGANPSGDVSLLLLNLPWGGSCAEGCIRADITIEQIKRDLQAYAIQYPHHALLDGVEIARAGNLPVSTTARSAFDELMAHRDDRR